MPVVFSAIFWLGLAALGWTYVGYPLLMFVRARLWPKPIQADSTVLPSVTLFVPAYNEADVIRRKLHNSLALAYPADLLQIVVVDDGSDDGTGDIVREFANQDVILLKQRERMGKIAAINRAFEYASGEIVVMSDASPNYEAHALQYIVQAFADPSVGVVVGKLALWDAENAVAKPAGLYWKYEAALRKWESATGSTVAVHGNMFAVRRSAFRPLPVTTINDEFSIAMEVMRRGYRVVYEPRAVSYDSASSKMHEEFNRRARINAGRYQALFSAGYLRTPNPELTFRLFSHKLLRPLTPIFMVLVLAANLLALLWPGNARSRNLFKLGKPWSALALAGQIAFYSMAQLGWLAERQGKSVKLFNFPYYFVNSNLAALVGFWRWIRGSQRVTWQKRVASYEEQEEPPEVEVSEKELVQ
jgi:poly-beta-1,6-N-acetyl-D-glucosamine synthase